MRRSLEAYRTMNLILWVLQIAAAFMFFNVGFAKILGDPQMVTMFGRIGFGQWLRFATGCVEILAALFLLVPAWAGFGAVLLALVTTGAVLVHIFLIGGSPATAVTLLVASVIILYGRRKGIYSLFGGGGHDFISGRLM